MLRHSYALQLMANEPNIFKASVALQSSEKKVI